MRSPVITDSELIALSHAEVLALPAADRLRWFKLLQVRHGLLNRAASDVLDLLTENNGVGLVYLIGCTGVGKTALTNRLIRTILAQSELDSGSLPFLYIEVPSNGNRSLSWRDIYERLLIAANEPLIEQKRSVVIEQGTARVLKYPALTVLRTALEEVIRHRRIKVIALDEAYHLLRFGNYASVMDTLKSLEDTTGVKILLIGSYDLFDLACHYGQAVRRGEIVHFPRYCKGEGGHEGEMKRVVEKLSELWPCHEKPNLSQINKELFAGHLGCVGLLKLICLRLLQSQLSNREKWKPEFLSKAVKPVKQLLAISKEISTGEEKIKSGTYGESVFTGDVLADSIAKMSVTR